MISGGRRRPRAPERPRRAVRPGGQQRGRGGHGQEQRRPEQARPPEPDGVRGDGRARHIIGLVVVPGKDAGTGGAAGHEGG
ncbi:hypothetical protein [Actinomadura sp. 21ATH]|uniref:hypothetical protein n=1 Tax=Actinomadura sp. 21ATH TaxID=1735444 RepID=UPI0035BF3C0B